MIVILDVQGCVVLGEIISQVSESFESKRRFPRLSTAENNWEEDVGEAQSCAEILAEILADSWDGDGKLLTELRGGLHRTVGVERDSQISSEKIRANKDDG